MKLIKFSGFPSGEAAPIAVSQGGRAASASLAQLGIFAGLAAPSDDQWVLRDEPSVTGGVAQIDVLELPVQADHVAAFLELAKDDGVGAPLIERLLMGPATNYVRRIAVTPERTTGVMLRVIWVEEGTGFEIAGQWSSVKTVTPSIAQPSVSIVSTRGLAAGEAVVPAGVQFAAEGLGFGVLRPFHDLRYKWTFPETGDYDRLPASHPWPRDRATSFGPVAGFTFTTPGVHRVLCEITDGVHTVTGEIDVVIDDPEVVFGTGTVRVGSDPTDTYADLGEAMRATTMAGGRRRILLRRGETFGSAALLDGLIRCQVGAFGTGPAPVVRARIGFRNITGEATIWGLDFRGDYDPGILTAQEKPPDGVDFGGLACACTVHDCDLTGIDTGVVPAGPEGTTVLTDLAIRDWHDYGIQGGDVGRFSMAGALVVQSSTAIMSGTVTHKAEAGPPRLADHGPIRLSRTLAPVSFDNCELFTNSDWSGNDSAVQNVYRLNTGGEYPFFCVLSRQRTEGGRLNIGSGNPGKRSSPADILIDKMVHVATVPGDNLLVLSTGGVTIRNTIFVLDGVPSQSTREATSFLRLGAPLRGDGSFTNDSKFNPVRVYNLTLVDLRNLDQLVGNNGVQQAFALLKDLPDPFADLIVANCVSYVPNAPTPIIDDAPLDTAPGAKPRFIGRRIWQEVDFSYAGASGRIVKNTTVTGALSGATGKIMTMTEPQAGSFGGGDARGAISIIVTAGDFKVGDMLDDRRGNRLALTAVNTEPSGLIARFANTSAATASFRPLNDPGGAGVSAAIGDADTSLPVAIDDLFGTLRGPAPSRGAMEPA